MEGFEPSLNSKTEYKGDFVVCDMHVPHPEVSKIIHDLWYTELTFGYTPPHPTPSSCCCCSFLFCFCFCFFVLFLVDVSLTTVDRTLKSDY